jgi:hypothetical protein
MSSSRSGAMSSSQHLPTAFASDTLLALNFVPSLFSTFRELNHVCQLRAR